MNIATAVWSQLRPEDAVCAMIHPAIFDASLSTEQIVEALQRYLANHDRWNSEFTWKKEDLGSSKSRTDVSTKTILLVLGIVAAGIVIWWYFNVS